MQALATLLGEEEPSTLQAVWAALAAVAGSIPKEAASGHVRGLRAAISSARERERRRKRTGPAVLPGLCLPKALAPLLPIYLQGLLQARLGIAGLRVESKTHIYLTSDGPHIDTSVRRCIVA